MVSTRRIGRKNKSAYGCFGWTLEISLEDRFAITAQGRVDERVTWSVYYKRYP